MKAILLLFLLLFGLASKAQLIPYNSSWKYLDNGTNQGTAWRSISFNDAAWKTGNTEFGYGDGGETTLLSFGSNAKKKYITTYFRKIVSITNPASYQNFTLSLKRDDGAVVYLNGVEVMRSNMPVGTVSYTTKASSEPADDGNTAQNATIASTAFVNGNNLIAVELHQFNGNGADLSFNLQLVGNIVTNQPPTVSAGADQTITLPTSSLSLIGSANDPDGSITSYAWTKLSGPAAGTIGSPSLASTAISGLTIAGTYLYRLTVTDNSNVTASDDVSITVNEEPVIVANPVINYGSSWKYLDNGTNQGTAWKETAFSDAGWASGNGQLGYGDGDEATTISFGPSSTAKYITSYFRKTINFNPAVFASMTLNLRRDDGVVVYVNGSEIYRNNMPTGTITYTTLASTAAADDGNTVQTAVIPTSAFISGANTIAVEMHQNAGSSSDLSFDMELRGSGALNVTRGPYLQAGNGTAVTVRWRTDVPSDTKLEAGTSFGIYDRAVSDAILTTEHSIRLTGLSPDTKYYYRLGSSATVLEGAANNYFITAPPATTERKTRIAVFGDCGRNQNGFQSGTLSSYLNYTANNPGELMLLLGDNAYENGTDAEYQTNFFNAYSPNILKNHMLFPAPGNHDYANTLARQVDKNVPYYNIFTMPTNGESGGVPSGTPSYYSFNWGNIHFLSLDSYGMENPNNMRLYDTTSPQVIWLKQDLDANKSKWKVAYWHHPPYTMGSHNSDTETELVRMRENFIRILERYGVDMVLCGHSHNYERSYLLKNHFGNEASFDINTHAVSSSSAKYDGSSNSCPYTTTTTNPEHGTVYVVSGSAGADGGVQAGYPHNALPFSFDDGGMLYFEVENNRLDAKYIRKDGVVADQFTIMKDVGRSTTASITNGESVTLTASWIGTYNWSNSATTRSITVSPSASTTFSCTDVRGCITDQFTVNVSVAPLAKQGMSTLYPVPVKRGSTLFINSIISKPYETVIYNAGGVQVKKIVIAGNTRINTTELVPGVYFIRLTEKGKSVMQRFMVAN